MKSYILGVLTGFLFVGAVAVAQDMGTPDGARNFIFQNQMRQQQREMLRQQQEMQQQLNGMRSPC